MQRTGFEALVARLQELSQRDPKGYQARVALLAGLGMLILLAVVAVSAGLLLALAAVPVALAVYGGQFFLLFLFKLGKLLFLLAIPLWVLVRGSAQAVFARFPRPTGREIGRAEAPELFRRLDWMRASMRGPRFHHVLLGDGLNAAVVQRPLFGLFGFPRNYLLLGLPLLEALPEREALAVVAHEYGHLAGAHSRFGAFIYRLRLTWSLIGTVAHHWKGWGGRLLARLIGWYAPYFNAYTFVLARSQEYLADAAAAQLLGSSTAASALKRVSVVGACYSTFMDDKFARVLHDADPPGDVGQDWRVHIAAPLEPDRANRYLASALQRRTDLADTHPALGDRLAALAAPEASESLPAGNVEASAAHSWFGARLEGLRDELAREWTERMREPWRRRRDELDRHRKRLSAIENRDVLTREEDWERLELRRELFPDDDHLAAITGFLARHGDEPHAYFRRALLRLQRDDEGGLDVLESAMRLDPEAIVPACSIAAQFRRGRDAARADACLERGAAAARDAAPAAAARR